MQLGASVAAVQREMSESEKSRVRQQADEMEANAVSQLREAELKRHEEKEQARGRIRGLVQNLRSTEEAMRLAEQVHREQAEKAARSATQEAERLQSTIVKLEEELQLAHLAAEMAAETKAKVMRLDPLTCPCHADRTLCY